MVSTPYKENGLMFQQACMTSELAPCLAMSHTELAPAAWQPAPVPACTCQDYESYTQGNRSTTSKIQPDGTKITRKVIHTLIKIYSANNTDIILT